MGLFSRFENSMENGLEGVASRMSGAPISPVQISKKAEKAMRREKMVGAGKQYAPTLYTVLVNPDDDRRLFGYYPTLAGETETYLSAKAAEEGFLMDGQPLVRFIVDEGLRRGKFDIIAELVSAPIIAQLRREEQQRYGLEGASPYSARPQAEPAPVQQASKPQRVQAEAPAQHEPLPYVPEHHIDFDDDFDNLGDFSSHEKEQAGSSAAVESFDAADTGLDGLDIPTFEPYSDTSEGTHTRTVGDIFDNHAVTPAPPVSPEIPTAYLIDTGNRRHILDKQRMIVGRSTTNDVILDDVNVSRSHAEIRYDQGGFWVITDLGSTNGTSVNGRRVSKVNLQDGDRITMGATDFRFSMA